MVIWFGWIDEISVRTAFSLSASLLARLSQNFSVLFATLSSFGVLLNARFQNRRMSIGVDLGILRRLPTDPSLCWVIRFIDSQ
jgi:hypothetical protein